MSTPPKERGAFQTSGLDVGEVRALFERLASTSLGLRAVRERQPLTADHARAAHARTAEVVMLLGAGDRPNLAGVSDPVPALEAVRRYKRPFEPAEIASLFAFLEARTRLASWLRERRADVPALAALGASLPDTSPLGAQLARVVDERGEIRDDATPKLARVRRESRELADQIARVVARVAADPALRSILTDGRVHRRGGRAVLAVKAKSSGRVQGVLHDRSQSGETVFVEPREAVVLSNRLAVLRADEHDELTRILVELTRGVLDEEPAVRGAAEGLAELELAVIGGAFCEAYGARVPELAGGDVEPGLSLRAARHPLLVDQQLRGELDAVCPIDVRLGEDFDLLVITGPNTGGKTLALKTVGIAALCTRMGLPVCCAEGSRVPLYDGLVADIGDEQEISQSLSTFASHLVRIQQALERAGPNTLCLLDELGGGTDPDEGAALGHAILEHLLERRTPTVVTTHLGRLKEFCFRNARAENASVEFDAVSLAPRYKLLIGTPGESNALAIARRLGLETELLDRAAARLERRDRDVVELMSQMRDAREHTEQLRTTAESKLEELARRDRDAQQQQEVIERRSELLEDEAQKALEERVRDARRALDRARAFVAQVPAGPAAGLRAALEECDRALSGAALTERRESFLRGLRKGQLVYVPRYEQRCVIARVDRGRGQVTVQVGKLKMKVGFDELADRS